MKSIKEMNISELAAFICSHLNSYGIRAVLSGGACVSIYTNNEYESFDLDFIENISTHKEKISEIMSKIGFVQDNRYYVNSDTKYYVEFPTGPLSIGSELVKKIEELDFPTGKLLLLSPTDCVKDRLAAYYYWDDMQSLDQAINVAKINKIEIDEILRWSQVEKQIEKFERIKHLFF
jgi:hypothetical protein